MQLVSKIGGRERIDSFGRKLYKIEHILHNYIDLTFYFLHKAIKMMLRNDITSSIELVTEIFYWVRIPRKVQVFEKILEFQYGNGSS